jgi:hypothetical protein
MNVIAFKRSITIFRISSNHRGKFKFGICNIDEYGRESEECFQKNPLVLANGKPEYEILDFSTGDFPVDLKLPSNLYCNHCVMRWTYVGGNRWDLCENGVGNNVSKINKMYYKDYYIFTQLFFPGLFEAARNLPVLF